MIITVILTASCTLIRLCGWWWTGGGFIAVRTGVGAVVVVVLARYVVIVVVIGVRVRRGSTIVGLRLVVCVWGIVLSDRKSVLLMVLAES